MAPQVDSVEFLGVSWVIRPRRNLNLEFNTIKLIYQEYKADEKCHFFYKMAPQKIDSVEFWVSHGS
jgi:hypothetical protein